MIENILTGGAQGEAIFVRRTLTGAHRSTLTAAQSLPPKAAAKSATPASASPARNRSRFPVSPGPKSDRLADAQIKAYVLGSRARGYAE